MSNAQNALTALKQEAPPRPAHAADTFWDDFKARARYSPRPQSAPRRILIIPPLATALASVVVLLSAVAVYTLHAPSPSGDSNIQINSLEVIASHGGVLIMEDEKSHGTIVWIMDMKNNET